MQRFTPHGTPPGQSALVPHGSAAVSAHVSHWHRKVVQPAARHSGFDVDSWRDFWPVVLDRSIGRFAMLAPAAGGQSRLVVPNDAFGDLPLASHGMPLRGPPEHVPCLFPSLNVGSPLQFGHGLESVMPLKTREVMLAVPVLSPVWRLAVPV